MKRRPAAHDDPGGAGDAPPGRIRLDRWLCYARVFKTRSLAAERISGGGIRINGAPCAKPAHGIGPGDIVTIGTGARVRVLRVLAPGDRRGPPDEAQTLFEELGNGDAR